MTRDFGGKPNTPPYSDKQDVEIGDRAIENVYALDHAWATGRGPGLDGTQRNFQ
jgi:hypothetical protein